MSNTVTLTLPRTASDWWQAKLQASDTWGNERLGILEAMRTAQPSQADPAIVTLAYRCSLLSSMRLMMDSYLDGVAHELKDARIMPDDIKADVSHASAILHACGFSGGLTKLPYRWKRYCDPIKVGAPQIEEQKKIEG